MIRVREGWMILVLTVLLAPVTGAQTKTTAASGEQKANAILNAVVDKLMVGLDAHWHKGEYNHDINLSRMIVCADPTNVDVYSNAGWLLWSMKRDSDAVALYKQGLKANPSTYRMYAELGMFYLDHKKNYPSAIQYYEIAVELEDCPPSALHMLAHAYEKNKMLEKALATWKRAVALRDNPNIGAAKRNMERVQKLLAEQDRPKQ